MNLIKKNLYLFILLFCFSSCRNDAVDFNNSLVNIQKIVLKEAQDFGEKMKEVSIDSFTAANVKTEADKIVVFINNKINEAQKLVAPKDGEILKEVILKQLDFEKDIVSKIGRLAEPDVSKEEKVQIETDFLSSQTKANKLAADVLAAQEAFAKQYKFKLKNK